VWTSSTASRRTLLVRGHFTDGRYRLEAAPEVPAPAAPAESRHSINLTRLSDDDYAWDTDVPYAIGSVSARELGAFLGALFASAEGREEAEIRADYRAMVPRTAVVLGKLFRVDSVRVTHSGDRSTLATYAVTMRPQGLHERYPNFAAYLRRYAQTARLRWSLTDRAGATYLEGAMTNGRMQLRVRTLGGGMVALIGPSRPMPDSLTLNGEFAMKVRRFTIGFRNYRADFVTLRTEHERAWSIVSRTEPEWALPFISERLLRSPLRRPFQGSGATFRVSVRDSTNSQTILNRRLHVEVKESAILKFIGRLSSIAVNDFTGRVEREEAAWLRELFEALVADVSALSSGL
jgi:hypothetical protein